MSGQWTAATGVGVGVGVGVDVDVGMHGAHLREEAEDVLEERLYDRAERRPLSLLAHFVPVVVVALQPRRGTLVFCTRASTSAHLHPRVLHQSKGLPETASSARFPATTSFRCSSAWTAFSHPLSLR